MILLNDPWREKERDERRVRFYRNATWLVQGLVWVLLGIMLGRLLK